jgi:hypothetical protein
MTDSAWTGGQAKTAWAIASAEPEDNDSEAGLVGVIVAGRAIPGLGY